MCVVPHQLQAMAHLRASSREQGGREQYDRVGLNKSSGKGQGRDQQHQLGSMAHLHNDEGDGDEE